MAMFRAVYKADPKNVIGYGTKGEINTILKDKGICSCLVRMDQIFAVFKGGEALYSGTIEDCRTWRDSKLYADLLDIRSI